MTLEDLIYKRLTEDEALAKLLARFNGTPAIAYQTAPQDEDRGWDGKRQYPRMDYIVDMQANPERGSSGVLTINIWCDEKGHPPEDIEPVVRAALQDILIKPDGSYPYNLGWARTDAFEQTRSLSGKQTLVIGATVLFDVFAFPTQETTDPDPIVAINERIKSWASEALVIGKDDLEPFTIPTARSPIFYFRLAAIQSQRETNTVAWMDGTIAGHIIAPEESRLQWLKALVDSLTQDGEVTMMDTSPMFLTSIKADSTASPIVTGQLRLAVRFGILRRTNYAHPMADITKKGAV